MSTRVHWQDDPELARVANRQMSIFARNARIVCAGIGLPWETAVDLHAEGLLGFDPASLDPLDDAREAELIFVGLLARTGCPCPLLRRLLHGLSPPYCYDARRLYFDWADERWRLLPGENDPEATFFSLLERLDTRDEREVLLALHAWLEEALDLDDERMLVLEHEHATRPSQS